VSLESCRNDVFLYHLRLLQVLDGAHAANEVRAYHFALLRQVLENISSFLGVGQFSYVLQQIGIADVEEVAGIMNTLSHKKVYYFESDDLNADSLAMFNKVFLGLKDKYQFVLHTPAAKTADALPTNAAAMPESEPAKVAVTSIAKPTSKKTKIRASHKAPKP